ncbi:MAG: hypothetical protein KGZ82_10410 [Bacteroidales bacterium]|nr:hypothetical protein [Bacteroidales bacterium]
MLTAESALKTFEDFSKLRVLIIGDVMVDAYLFGKVDRISPEAPVPVVAVQDRVNRLGGAANVALNIKSLGAEAILCAAIGPDQKGKEFFEILDQHQLPKHGILQCSDRPTTTKYRVIGNKTQMLRVDEEVTNDLSTKDQKRLWKLIEGILHGEKIDVIIFQDYNKGVITKWLITNTIRLAREINIPLVVDPKKKNFLAYKHCTLFKPNLKELKEGLDIQFDAGSEVQTAHAMAVLQEKLHADMILLTLSERGVFMRTNVANSNQLHHVPAFLRNIADVSGAGDTVISVASLCLALGQQPKYIAAISNLAGGLVCEEVGVVPVDKNKLLQEVLKLLVNTHA